MVTVPFTITHAVRGALVGGEPLANSAARGPGSGKPPTAPPRTTVGDGLDVALVELRPLGVGIGPHRGSAANCELLISRTPPRVVNR